LLTNFLNSPHTILNLFALAAFIFSSMPIALMYAYVFISTIFSRNYSVNLLLSNDLDVICFLNSYIRFLSELSINHVENIFYLYIVVALTIDGLVISG
jgi:hypothetical protein